MSCGCCSSRRAHAAVRNLHRQTVNTGQGSAATDEIRHFLVVYYVSVGETTEASHRD